MRNLAKRLLISEAHQPKKKEEKGLKAISPSGKPLEVIESNNFSAQAVDNKFFKPEEKGEVKLINADEIDKLIDLLENEAKVL